LNKKDQNCSEKPELPQPDFGANSLEPVEDLFVYFKKWEIEIKSSQI